MLVMVVATYLIFNCSISSGVGSTTILLITLLTNKLFVKESKVNSMMIELFPEV